MQMRAELVAKSTHFKLNIYTTHHNYFAKYRPIAYRGRVWCTHPPQKKTPKKVYFKPLMMGQKLGFCRRFRGKGLKKKTLFWFKVHFFGMLHCLPLPLKKIQSWLLWAWLSMHQKKVGHIHLKTNLNFVILLQSKYRMKRSKIYIQNVPNMPSDVILWSAPVFRSHNECENQFMTIHELIISHLRFYIFSAFTRIYPPNLIGYCAAYYYYNTQAKNTLQAKRWHVSKT